MIKGIARTLKGNLRIRTNTLLFLAGTQLLRNSNYQFKYTIFFTHIEPLHKLLFLFHSVILYFCIIIWL